MLSTRQSRQVRIAETGGVDGEEGLLGHIHQRGRQFRRRVRHPPQKRALACSFMAAKPNLRNDPARKNDSIGPIAVSDDDKGVWFRRLSRTRTNSHRCPFGRRAARRRQVRRSTGTGRIPESVGYRGVIPVRAALSPASSAAVPSETRDSAFASITRFAVDFGNGTADMVHS